MTQLPYRLNIILYFPRENIPQLVVESTLVEAWLKSPSREKIEVVLSMFGSTQSHETSLPAFLVKIESITMIKRCI